MENNIENMIRKHTLETAVILVLLFWIFVFTSCGTRKAETAKQQRDSINIENHYASIDRTILSTSFKYTPFDGLKPMIIEGKKYENAIISGGTFSEKYHHFNIYNKKNITKTYSVTKATDRENHDLLYLGIFTVIAVLVFLWFKF